jgi:hypothetical protein
MIPNDILIPANAKYISFVDDKKEFNPHFDIVWSFKIALSGTEHGFSTFLSNSTDIIPYRGHYIGLPIESESLDTESSINIVTEYGNNLTSEIALSSAILSIAFDTVGYAALSTPFIPGLRRSEIKRNSITIRDDSREVIYHEALSALSTEFVMSSSRKYWNTLRFKVSNIGTKLDIDLKTTDKYKNIVSIPINIQIQYNDKILPGFSFMSPLSSNLIQPSTLFLNNFHIQGKTQEPTYEIIEPTLFKIDDKVEYNVYSNKDKDTIVYNI